jgi:hypothetical protein
MSVPKIVDEGRQALIEGGVLVEGVAQVVEAVAAVGGGIVEKRLVTDLLHQKQDEWCWASVAECIADAYHDGPAGQCQIASAVLSTPAAPRQCCPEGVNNNCNVQQLLSSALTVKNNFVSFRADLSGQPFSFPFVKSHIDHQKPLPAHISYPDTGHYVVIIGYREEPGAKLVFVRDPANADHVWSAVDFTQFLNAYKFAGKWDGSYETRGSIPPALA